MTTSYLTTVWYALDPEIRAEIAAGKHKEFGGLHDLRRDILADEAEKRALWDAFSDVLNKSKRWMD